MKFIKKPSRGRSFIGFQSRYFLLVDWFIQWLLLFKGVFLIEYALEMLIFGKAFGSIVWLSDCGLITPQFQDHI